MIDSYPDTLAAIETHLSGSDPYTVPWGNMRAMLYNFQYIPHSIHDGLYKADPYTTYESKFLARQAVATDVTVDLAVFGAGDTWRVTANVCIESGGTGKTMKIWVAQVLDHFQLPPQAPTRNALRNGSAGVEITLAPDECADVTEVLVLDAYSLASPENVKFFAWAQNPTFTWDPTSPPVGASFAEIYQGAKALAPFAGVMRDDFEDGTTAAWELTVP